MLRIIKLKVEYYTPDAIVSGLSYGQWTVKWWQWSLSIPSERNPVLDDTGINAGENQPEDVWFLAGIWADDDTKKIFPRRKCRSPKQAVPLLVPIMNCEADPIEYPEIRE